MARVYTRTAKKEGLVCGRDKQPIAKGETYTYAMPGFRSSWKSRKIRCAKHPFRRSELTNSLRADAYAALEAAEDDLNGLDPRQVESTSELEDILQTAADSIQEVADAYSEAAENFGGGGPNGEAKDEMEGAVGELDANFDDFDGEGCEEHNTPERADAGTPTFDEGCNDCLDIRAEWAQGQIEAALDTLSGVSI